MPIAIKYVLAGLLLVGVSVVWMPRVTGFDPLAWLSRDKPVSEFSSYPIDAPIDEPLPVEGEAGAAQIGDLPAKELEQIVHFLESRDLAAEPKAVPAQPSVVVAERRDGAAIETSEVSKDLQPLEVFLTQHPLNAILIGKGQGSALFGTRRVVAGDQLLDGSVEVRSIEAGGVLLETAQGRVRVPMPPPGGRVLETKQP